MELIKKITLDQIKPIEQMILYIPEIKNQTVMQLFEEFNCKRKYLCPISLPNDNPDLLKKILLYKYYGDFATNTYFSGKSIDLLEFFKKPGEKYRCIS